MPHAVVSSHLPPLFLRLRGAGLLHRPQSQVSGRLVEQHLLSSANRVMSLSARNLFRHCDK